MSSIIRSTIAAGYDEQRTKHFYTQARPLNIFAQHKSQVIKNKTDKYYDHSKNIDWSTPDNAALLMTRLIRRLVINPYL